MTSRIVRVLAEPDQGSKEQNEFAVHGLPTRLVAPRPRSPFYVPGQPPRPERTRSSVCLFCLAALRLKADLIGFVSQVLGCDEGLADELFTRRSRHDIKGVEGVVENRELLDDRMAHVPEYLVIACVNC